MRAAIFAGLMAVVAACGPHETHFIPDFADRYCDLVLECSASADLTFDGISSHDDCLATYGHSIDSIGDGCKFRKKAGKQCLKAMELMSCPADGAPLADSLPPECNGVYDACLFDVEREVAAEEPEAGSESPE